MTQRSPDNRPENPFVAHIRRFWFAPIKNKHPVPSQSPSARDDAGAFFTREYLPFLSAAFEIWQQDDFWEGDADEIQQAKDWISELETMLMSGNCGKSRSPLFDAATLVLREVFADQFDTGGLDELAPDRPDTYWAEDSGDTGDEIAQRDLALCLACQDYVTQMMFQAFDAILDAGISVFAGGTVMTLVLGVPGALLVSALGAVWGLSLATLKQDDVRDAIACCMNASLEGVAISESSFRAALDGACDVPFSPPGDAVHLFVRATLQDSGNYLSFVNMLGSFNDVAGSGIVSCFCDEWEHVFDFTVDDGDWEDTAEACSTDWGATYVAATHWRSSGVSPQISFRMKRELERDGTFTEVRATLTGNMARRLTFSRLLPCTTEFEEDINPDGSWGAFEGTIEKVDHLLILNLQATGAGEPITCSELAFRGTGPNPFIS